MTKVEWLACEDPYQMLEALQGLASERKLRLFACSCARSLWHALTEECSRLAVLTAERYTEGAATKQQMAEARSALRADFRYKRRKEIVERVWADTKDGDAAEARAREWASAWDTAQYTLRAKAHDAAQLAAYPRTAEQARFLRCIFGNPFRKLSPIDPVVLEANNGLLVQLAQAGYEHRSLPDGLLDPARLTVLADALEEAGADADMVDHLRGPGPHVRGCFVLDVLLGKK